MAAEVLHADGQTDWRREGCTDRQTDGQTYWQTWRSY